MLLDLLYQVMASPSKAFWVVREKRPLGWAILTAIFISVVFALILLPNPPQLVEVILSLERGKLSLASVIPIWVIIFLVALLIQAGFFHMVALLLRGRGSYLGMLCGVCFACFPLVFSAPLALLRVLLDSLSGHLLYYILSLIFFLWILLLYVIAIRQNYDFPLKKAVVTCFTPALVVIIIPLLVLVISMAF
ncbi:MAG: YIP1 family protein [Dehalococcoidia bacterium]|nr:MAG: YIP1 family protein [Dehalococcoidia bacterium]